MTQQNLRTLAKKGNPKALAAMLNQSLKSKNITAKVGLKENCLQILLESAQLPNQEAMVSFIHNGLAKLGVESIKTVKVYGRRIGEESPAWSQTFEMVSPQEMPSSPESTDFQNLLSQETPQDTRRPTSLEAETPSSPESTDLQNLLFHQTPHQTPKPTSSELETSSSTRQTDRQNLQRNAATSQTANLQQPIGPLSAGNVVSAGLRIYRSHLKTYLQLALKAYLWALVPIYGWAKYCAISAMISRLAFGELTNQPESVTTANRYVNQRLWSFFRVAFQVFIFLAGVYLGLLIVCYLTIVLLGFGVGLLLGNLIGSPIITGIFMAIFTLVGVLSFIYGFIWFVSRWLVAEVPLAVEESINGQQSVARTWELTKNSVRRIQGVVSVAFLVSLPIPLVTTYIPHLLLLQFEKGSSSFGIMYFIYLVASLGGAILILPFWQAIKAVLYYDLRSRREGLGLHLRDSMSR